jgi:hypothetical protein
MEQLFLHKIKDEDVLEKLLEWYTQRSQTSAYIRDEIMKEHQLGRGSVLIGMNAARLSDIVRSRPSEDPNLNSRI